MAMPRRDPLSSAFAGRLEGYVSYKRGELGYRATNEENVLAPSFDRFCRERYPEKTALDLELALAWVSDAEGPVANIVRASFMREFARYIVQEGEEACVLPGKISPIKRGAAMPHIFTQDEIDAFFTAADSMKPSRQAPVRHLVSPVYFRLLYCAGLRPYEARVLTVGQFDLDDGIIHVIDSKGRDRDVPLKADVTALCREYSEAIEAVFPGRAAFFPNSRGDGCMDWQAMHRSFWICWEDAGMTEFSGPRPRPYDFRHTFATDCIRRWRDEGVDVGANLKFLQEFMGHARIERTLYYVHLVRGGLGDPTLYETWEPDNRARTEGHYGTA